MRVFFVIRLRRGTLRTNGPGGPLDGIRVGEGPHWGFRYSSPFLLGGAEFERTARCRPDSWRYELFPKPPASS
jgi:hypothetical protein